MATPYDDYAIDAMRYSASGGISGPSPSWIAHKQERLEYMVEAGDLLGAAIEAGEGDQVRRIKFFLEENNSIMGLQAGMSLEMQSGEVWNVRRIIDDRNYNIVKAAERQKLFAMTMEQMLHTITENFYIIKKET